MTTIALPLLSGNFGNGVGIQFNTGGGAGLLYPGNAVDFGEFADAVTFSASLSAVGGGKLSSVVAAASTDAFTSTAHGLANNTLVHVHASGFGTSLPGGITDGGTYYVVNATTNTFKLSTTSGGGAIDITADGQASIFYDIPTTWKVGLKFQVLHTHTEGGMFQKRQWVDLGKYNVASAISEGVGFGNTSQGVTDATLLEPPLDGGFGYIADQNTSLATPITVMRTIRDFGHGVRVMLDLPATGGTSPRANLSIVAYAHAKGR
jgi:hypothetical protein